MTCICQSRDYTGALAAFGLERLMDIGSTFVKLAVSGLPGVARRLVTFFALPKKVTKERRPEVRRPRKSAGMPCVTRNDRPLRNSGSNGRRFKRLSLCAPSDSPRGLLLSYLRYSATLIGTRSRCGHRKLVPSSPRRWDPVALN